MTAGTRKPVRIDLEILLLPLRLHVSSRLSVYRGKISAVSTISNRDLGYIATDLQRKDKCTYVLWGFTLSGHTETENGPGDMSKHNLYYPGSGCE